jgi:hypothetical protein
MTEGGPSSFSWVWFDPASGAWEHSLAMSINFEAGAADSGNVHEHWVISDGSFRGNRHVGFSLAGSSR